MKKIEIRRLTAKDAPDTAQLFFSAVRKGTKSHYSRKQRHAWAPSIPKRMRWSGRLSVQNGFIAERDGVIVGFMTLRRDGTIDLAYVAPDQAGKGIGGALYAAIEAEARRRGLRILQTEASYLARGFFRRHGWTVTRKQCVVRRGVALENFVMLKALR